MDASYKYKAGRITTILTANKREPIVGAVDRRPLQVDVHQQELEPKRLREMGGKGRGSTWHLDIDLESFERVSTEIIHDPNNTRLWNKSKGYKEREQSTDLWST